MTSFLLSWWRRLRGTDSLGARGERLAARWLKRRKNFRILAHNWRSPRDRRDELDLVCLDGAVLVFVEVKTRAASALVQGYDAIDARKRRVLRRAADAFPTAVGTAQAIHLATLLELQSAHGITCLLATADEELLRAAESMGIGDALKAPAEPEPAPAPAPAETPAPEAAPETGIA